MENVHFLVIDKCDAWAVVVKDKSDYAATFLVYKSSSYVGEDHTNTSSLLFGDSYVSADKLETIEPFADAYIKWDGCSTWDFEESLHICGLDSAKSFSRMLEFVFDVARKEIPKWEDD